jgi:hypothetical protein
MDLEILIFIYKRGNKLQSQFKEDIRGENKKSMLYFSLRFRAGTPDISPLLPQSRNHIGLQEVARSFLPLALGIFYYEENMESKKGYEERSFQFCYVLKSLWACTAGKEFRNDSISKFTLSFIAVLTFHFLNPI